MSEYLANSVRAYGFGYSAAEALGNMASHAQHDAGDGVLEVTIVQYETDAHAAASPAGYHIEGEIESERTYEIPDEKIGEIADLAGELELLVDSTLADAEEVSG